MAAELESGVYGNGKVPWHGLGTVLPAEIPWESISELVPMWFSKVSKVPAYQRLADGSFIEVPGNYLNVRNLDEKVVGVVEGRHTIIQSMEGLAVAKPLIDAGVASIDALFTLRNGSWSVASLKWNGEHGDIDGPTSDQIQKYILLVNTFNGDSPFRMFFTGLRVECMNLTRLAIQEAQSSLIIRHTRNSVGKVEELKRIVNAGGRYFGSMNKVFEDMKTKSFTSERLLEALKKIYKVKAAEDQSKKAKTQFEKLSNRVIELFETAAMGNHVDGFKGTVYGAYNAITEYVDHESTTRVHGKDGMSDSEKEFKALENKLFSNLFGSGQDTKELAYVILRDMTA